MAPSALVAALPASPWIARRTSLSPIGPLQTSASRAGPSQPGVGTSGIRFTGNPVQQATPGALPLSLDDAIDRGLKHNLQVLLATQTEQSVRGQILGVYFALLPNMSATAYTNALELNLAAHGIQALVAGRVRLRPRNRSTRS